MIRKSFFLCSVASFMLLAACDEVKPNTTTLNAKAVEDNQLRLQTAIPAPRLQTSLERKNLRDRLERLNAENMTGYIYLFSYGRVMAFYPVKGKVTSLNAYLMAGEAPQRMQISQTEGHVIELVEQPDYDGAYGKNDDGIFFFTTEGVYVEWKGEYLFSDQPLNLTQEPLLVRELNK